MQSDLRAALPEGNVPDAQRLQRCCRLEMNVFQINTVRDQIQRNSLKTGISVWLLLYRIWSCPTFIILRGQLACGETTVCQKSQSQPVYCHRMALEKSALLTRLSLLLSHLSPSQPWSPRMHSNTWDPLCCTQWQLLCQPGCSITLMRCTEGLFHPHCVCVCHVFYMWYGKSLYWLGDIHWLAAVW